MKKRRKTKKKTGLRGTGSKVRKAPKSKIGKSLKTYSDMESRVSLNAKGTAIKGASELAAILGGGTLGSVLGPTVKGFGGVGAGFALWLTGLLAGDRTHLLQTAGVAAMAYSFGTAQENRAIANDPTLQGLSGVKDKLGQGFSRFKNDFLMSIGAKAIENSEAVISTDETVGNVTLDDLNQFMKINKIAAIEHETEQAKIEDFAEQFQLNFSDEVEPIEGFDEEGEVDFGFNTYEEIVDTTHM